MTLKNWPAPNVWVHVLTQPEAIASNPAEVTIFFFGLICYCLNCNYHCDDPIFI